MSVEEIKRGLESLSKAQQDEVSAFLSHLRRAHDSDEDLLAPAAVRQATLDSFYEDASADDSDPW